MSEWRPTLVPNTGRDYVEPRSTSEAFFEQKPKTVTVGMGVEDIIDAIRRDVFRANDQEIP